MSHFAYQNWRPPADSALLGVDEPGPVDSYLWLLVQVQGRLDARFPQAEVAGDHYAVYFVVLVR